LPSPKPGRQGFTQIGDELRGKMEREEKEANLKKSSERKNFSWLSDRTAF
jgi:hypothetical protein